MNNDKNFVEPVLPEDNDVEAHGLEGEDADFAAVAFCACVHEGRPW